MGKTGAPPLAKRKKVFVPFNEEARKEYLTGFRKRRQERQEKAHIMLERKLERKIKDQRNKRRKKTQEKVDQLLKGVRLPGDDEEEMGEEGVVDSGVSETVDFDDHTAVVTVCAGFGESGLVLAPSQDDDEVDDSSNKNTNTNEGHNANSQNENDNSKKKEREREKVKKIIEMQRQKKKRRKWQAKEAGKADETEMSGKGGKGKKKGKGGKVKKRGKR